MTIVETTLQLPVAVTLNVRLLSTLFPLPPTPSHLFLSLPESSTQVHMRGYPLKSGPPYSTYCENIPAYYRIFITRE